MTARRLAHRRLRRFGHSAAAYALLISLSLIVLVPLMWMVGTSLKSNSEVFQSPPTLWPAEPLWNNYPDAIGAVPFLRWAANSALLVGVNVIATLFSCTVVAYGFARLRFPGRDRLFLLVLATLLLPYQMTLIPEFLLYAKIGWVGTYLPLTVPAFFGVGGAFYIFLLRQYLRTIPLELDEAARIDGCSYFQVLRFILIPLMRAPLTIVAVFSFAGVYADFLRPLIYIQKADDFTLPIGLATYVSTHVTQWNWLMAASLVVLVPQLVVFFAGQRQLIRGIASVGLKG